MISERSHEYKFVRLSTNRTIYLLSRGRSQILSLGNPDLESCTVASFGFNASDLQLISLEALVEYPLHEYAVPLVKEEFFSADELMRVHTLKVQHNTILLATWH